jgi:hypothetical protein
VSWAIGYSDAKKRAAFEKTKDGGFRPSLITLKYIREVELDIDGAKERGLLITPLGREALKK